MQIFSEIIGFLKSITFKAFTNSSPTNGDLWYDGTDVNIRTGGITKALGAVSGGTAGEILTSNGGSAATFQHQMLFFSFTANNPVANVTAQNNYDWDRTTSGAAVGDLVILTPPAYSPAKLIITAWVSSTNTVRIRFSNIGTTTINAGSSGTWQICIIKP